MFYDNRFSMVFFINSSIKETKYDSPVVAGVRFGTGIDELKQSISCFKFERTAIVKFKSFQRFSIPKRKMQLKKKMLRKYFR